MSKHKPGSSQATKADSSYRKKIKDIRAAKRAQKNLTADELLEQAKAHPNTKAMLSRKAKEAAEKAAAHDPIEDAEEIELSEVHT